MLQQLTQDLPRVQDSVAFEKMVKALEGRGSQCHANKRRGIPDWLTPYPL